MIDGNIFLFFPIMMEQFAEERSMKATLLLLPATKWLVPERSLKANGAVFLKDPREVFIKPFAHCRFLSFLFFFFCAANQGMDREMMES